MRDDLPLIYGSICPLKQTILIRIGDDVLPIGGEEELFPELTFPGSAGKRWCASDICFLAEMAVVPPQKKKN